MKSTNGELDNIKISGCNCTSVCEKRKVSGIEDSALSKHNQRLALYRFSRLSKNIDEKFGL